MNREEALREFDELKASFLSRVPLEHKRVKGIVETRMDGGRVHLQAIYAAGMEVGPDFNFVQTYFGNKSYEFWVNGVQRHIGVCKLCLDKL